MYKKVEKSKVVQIDSPEKWNLVVSNPMYQAIPVIVYFTTAWCKPSMAMKPLFEELASIHNDALFLSVDVDDVKGVMEKMKIKAMPTFVMLTIDNKREGEVIDKVVGANPDEVKKRIDAFIDSIGL